MSNSHTNKLLQSIVSSQLDADRFDYMLRDSYMTGVHYGKFDINWMLKNLSIGEKVAEDEDKTKHQREKTIVVDGRRGISTLQDYLIGLFNLYKHVYHHKTVLIAEGMLETILNLAISYNNANQGSNIDFSHAFFDRMSKGEEITLDEYLSLDDILISSWIHDWSESDKIPRELKNLSLHFLNRQLFKGFFVDLDGFALVNFMDKIKKVIEDDGFDPKIFLIMIDPKRMAYKNIFFMGKKDKGKQTNTQEEIHFLDRDNNIKMYTSDKEELSEAIHKMKFEELLVAFPKKYNDKICMIYKEYKNE